MFKINVLKFTEQDKTKILTTHIVSNKEELFQNCGIQLSDTEFERVINEPYLEFDNIGFIGSKITDEEYNRIAISEQKANQYYSEIRYIEGVNGLQGNAILVEVEINEKQRIEIDYDKFDSDFKDLSVEKQREAVVNYITCSGDIKKPDWVIGKIELK